jgi:pilus assembly protein CpaD
MRSNRSFIAVALTVFVGACAPVTTYTDAEATNSLKLDSATTQVSLHFAPGSATLAPGDAARLRQLAATGRIEASDRVTVAVAGPPALANARAGAVAATLVNYGVVPIASYGDAPPNAAVVAITRTLVTLPACPNWSKPSYSDFGNQPSSNFGCATETNLGMMVAHPTDLASGLPSGGGSGQPAAAAVNRYLNDKVELPNANTALPIAVQGGSQQGGGNANPSSPSGTGSGSGGSQ